MFQPEDNFNADQSRNTPKNDAEQNLDNIDANLSTKSVALRKKQLESIFTKLIVFGLALGTVLGIGAYYLLNKLGLTKKPDQLEREKIEREKTPSSSVEEIKASPLLNAENNRFEI